MSQNNAKVAPKPAATLNKKIWNDLNQALDVGLALEERSSRHPDHQEAARAFVEKRTPQYKGTI